MTDDELDDVAQRLVGEHVGRSSAGRFDDVLDHRRHRPETMTQSPGGAARVQRTSTTLVDRRELIYFDDSELYRSGWGA